MKLLRKKGKKAFTLVELVVVIAVIGILAGVSVGTYFGVVNSANISADEQAVTQMNTVLQTNEVNSKNESILNVFQLFDENGLSAKEYKPLTKDTGFYRSKTENRIFILNETSKEVIYPTKYQQFNYAPGSLYSLSGEMKADNEYITTSNSANKIETATITNGNEFYSLTQDISKESNKYNDTITIKLANDIDLMGVSGIAINDETKNIVIEGTSSARSNTTVHGFVNYINQFVANDGEGKPWNYSYGLIPTVKNQNITFKNINFDSCETIGDSSSLGVGSLIGQIYGNSNITFDNVHITNAKVYGGQFVGGFIGRVLYDAGNSSSEEGNVKLNFKNSSISNSRVGATFGQNGGLVGSINELCNFTATEKENVQLANNRLKSLINISNTIVDDTVKLPVDGVESIEYKINKGQVIAHTNTPGDSASSTVSESTSLYKINADRTMRGGIYFYENWNYYGVFSTAKLFNINPTGRHDTGSSRGEGSLNYKNGILRFNCCLYPVDSIEDFNNIEIIGLENKLQ